jgi:hypothetical protein
MFSSGRLVLLLSVLLSQIAGAIMEPGAFIEEYCANCHDAETKKGGLDLTAFAWNLEDRNNFQQWVKVVDQVANGEMPPKKKARPEPAAAQAFVAALGHELRSFEIQRQAQSGRAVLRRLNRVEYEHTMHDLLGIDTPLATLLPADSSMHGFDTVAEGLRLSTLQMEKYLEAADLAIDAAIDFGPEPERLKKRCFLKDEAGVRKNVDTPEGTLSNPNDPKSKHRQTVLERPDGSIVYFNEGYPPAEVKQLGRLAAGSYRIRISGYGFQSAGQTISMRVYSDNYREKVLLGWFDMPPDEPRVVEFTAKLRANEHLRIEPTNTGIDDKGQNVYNIGAKTFTGAGLALQWVEVEGPLRQAWPPASMKNLFGDTPLEKIDDPKKRGDQRVAYEFVIEDARARAQQVLERFAARAFRRPLEPGEADRFVKLATDEIDQMRPFQDAIRVGARAILTSPQFLLFEEPPGKLGDYALASRLSYFLWSSMPDEELLALAAAKKLTQPDVLRAQTERMLEHEKSRAFVRNFTGQWLDLRNIDATSPDKKLYPESDELLIVSMVQETEAFFAEMLKENLSARNVIHSDFAILNSRLAAHYSIEGVAGEELRKVPLPPDSPRGGILTQASVLKVTANGTTTSPVLRGAWVMKKILGQPPSPPPPGTGMIEPDTRGATTVREQLAKHRSSESCAGCHAKIDPPGFALECFDVIGGFRDRYRSQDKGETTTVKNSRGKRKYVKLGLTVDATGELPDGRTFAGIQEFRKMLLEQSDQLLKALTENVAIYSTGAGISYADRPVVAEITAKVKQQGGGLRTLIHEVVQSPLFQTK